MKKLLKTLAPRWLISQYEKELRKETHINRSLAKKTGSTTYVEIGVRNGACIHQIRADRKIAIDPAPVDPQHIRKDGTEIFEVPSDEFFEKFQSKALATSKVDVALIDGLHEFEQALRDVLHLESTMSNDGVIYLHDCNPPTEKHESDPNGPWNGDVWKVALYLTRHRPDLRFHTLDCDWGLGVLSGFGKASSPPSQETIDEIKALTYSTLERDRKRILRLRHPLLSRF